MKTADKKQLVDEKLPLNEQLVSKRVELIEVRKSLAAGTLQNPRSLKKIKKDIARILTKSRQEENANTKEGE
jgi:ribosomal protein L29